MNIEQMVKYQTKKDNDSVSLRKAEKEDFRQFQRPGQTLTVPDDCYVVEYKKYDPDTGLEVEPVRHVVSLSYIDATVTKLKDAIAQYMQLKSDLQAIVVDAEPAPVEKVKP